MVTPCPTLRQLRGKNESGFDGDDILSVDKAGLDLLYHLPVLNELVLWDLAKCLDSGESSSENIYINFFK